MSASFSFFVFPRFSLGMPLLIELYFREIIAVGKLFPPSLNLFHALILPSLLRGDKITGRRKITISVMSQEEPQYQLV